MVCFITHQFLYLVSCILGTFQRALRVNIVWITNERSLLSAGFESRVYRGKDVNSTEVGISRGRHKALNWSMVK